MRFNCCFFPFFIRVGEACYSSSYKLGISIIIIEYFRTAKVNKYLKMRVVFIGSAESTVTFPFVVFGLFYKRECQVSWISAEGWGGRQVGQQIGHLRVVKVILMDVNRLADVFHRTCILGEGVGYEWRQAVVS